MSSEVLVKRDGDAWIIQCPHCHDLVYVHEKELNCRIFRHGAYKHTLAPIPPHASKQECDRLVQQNLIYGCGKPFELVNNDQDQMVVQMCEYK